MEIRLLKIKDILKESEVTAGGKLQVDAGAFGLNWETSIWSGQILFTHNSEHIPCVLVIP